MGRSLTQKQENFVNNIFQGMTQREAWIKAGYSSKYSLAAIDVHACQLAGKDKVKIRLEEMRQAAKSGLITDEIRRKEILSQIAEGDLTDYVTCGPDRDLVSVGPESPKTKSLQEVTSRTEFDKDGSGVAVVTKVKLKDSIKAIETLNKMEGVYTSGDSSTVNINIEKLVIDARGKLENALTRLALRAGEADIPQRSD